MGDQAMSDASSGGSISVLSDEECWQLLQATTVGRVGFVRGDDVLIIPVNYFVDQSVYFRTLPGGVLAPLVDGPRVTFQVDHHASGSGWSVLMHGNLERVGDDEAATLQGLNRVLPWAGGERDLLLRLRPDHVSGRRVRRNRNP